MTFEHWAILLTIFIAVLITLHYSKSRRGYFSSYRPGEEVVEIWDEKSYLQELKDILKIAVPALIIGMIIGGAVW